MKSSIIAKFPTYQGTINTAGREGDRRGLERLLPLLSDHASPRWEIKIFFIGFT